MPLPCSEAADAAARLRQLAWWALQFTPRVALCEDAVLLELGASLRLFGGRRALHRRLLAELGESSLAGLAWAPTSLGALALARGGVVNGFARPLAELLDALPLPCLSATQEAGAMLERLGCRCLADLRGLPRAPTARRFGEALLEALDQAYGLAPEAHDWVLAPESFELRRELPFRIEHAPALLHYAEALLHQLCAWLAARRAGIRTLTLAWQHDAMRPREAGLGGELRLATAEPTRQFAHLQRLLGEHLGQTRLEAPAGELRLSADCIELLPDDSFSLLPDDPDQAREPLLQLLERMAVRLGPENVRRAAPREDHRLECLQDWLPWGQVLPTRPPTGGLLPLEPQPSWLLDPPLRLLARHDQPLYCGELQLLLGPQRIEGGWWGGRPEPAQVQRDYFLARNPAQALLWIFHERLAGEQPHWYLHGVFA
ncbi:DNA polymerase Y family protein [Pelomonas sp. SE-A7]|uniref:Y-family DNA polymerase n=1 Tax=Pelomonas sp. SE-A7 TaxID=3054953 RepID=UPI00259CD607|nr:DNA polymerase Y family protein [Pelomonas sp. SE-A7]MDM4766247.1 DNA polymerase Y family protein [Pelomonas sp. SE-A7]